LPKRHFWFIVNPRGNDDDREKKCREDGARYSQANPQKYSAEEKIRIVLKVTA